MEKDSGQKSDAQRPGGEEASFSQRAGRRRRTIQSFEAQMRTKRTTVERVADWLTEQFGTMRFMVINVVWFTAWIIINLGAIPGVAPFDPYPFNLLTTVVSLEAIFLSIFVLITQNRQSQIDDLRQEVDLQVNLVAEEEITKIMNLLSHLHKHFNINQERKDPELERMLKPLDPKEIEERLREQLDIKR